MRSSRTTSSSTFSGGRRASSSQLGRLCALAPPPCPRSAAACGAHAGLRAPAERGRPLRQPASFRAAACRGRARPAAERGQRRASWLWPTAPRTAVLLLSRGDFCVSRRPHVPSWPRRCGGPSSASEAPCGLCGARAEVRAARSAAQSAAAPRAACRCASLARPPLAMRAVGCLRAPERGRRSRLLSAQRSAAAERVRQTWAAVLRAAAGSRGVCIARRLLSGCFETRVAGFRAASRAPATARARERALEPRASRLFYLGTRSQLLCGDLYSGDVCVCVFVTCTTSSTMPKIISGGGTCFCVLRKVKTEIQI